MPTSNTPVAFIQTALEAKMFSCPLADPRGFALEEALKSLKIEYRVGSATGDDVTFYMAGHPKFAPDGQSMESRLKVGMTVFSTRSWTKLKIASIDHAAGMVADKDNRACSFSEIHIP